MKKSILFLIMITLMCLMFAGCSKTPDANEPDQDSASTTISSEVETTTTTVAETTVAESETTTDPATTTTATEDPTTATAENKTTTTATANKTTTQQPANTTTKKPTTTTTKKPTTTTTTPMKAVDEYKWVYNNIPNGLMYELTFFDEPSGNYVGQWNRSGWASLDSLDLPEGVTIEPDIVIEGVGYINNSGNGGAFKIAINGNTVTITTDFSEVLVLERMEDKKMKVTSSDIDGIQKGAIFIAE